MNGTVSTEHGREASLSTISPPSAHSQTEAIIETFDVSYVYPGCKALDRVSFKIPKGSVTALVGPNGAGKSTLLRLLGALDTPFSGRIIVNGQATVEDPRKVHEMLGYLPDRFGLYEDLTVREALRYFAKAKRVAPGEVTQRVEETMVDLDLSELASRYPSQLSRGQRQRLGLGQAIIHNPSLILLDEPASGLDPEARLELSSLIRRYQSRGATLIVSSHILSELQDYSEWLLMVRGGKIVSHEPVAEPISEKRTVRLCIRLVEVPRDLSLLIKAGFTDPVVERGDVLLSFTGSPLQQAEALRNLLNEGFLFSEVFPLSRDLEALYMKNI